MDWRDDFDVDRLANYIRMFGNPPGAIIDGHLVGGSWDYVNPLAPMLWGGRVIGKVDHPLSGASHNIVGYSTADNGGTPSHTDAFLRATVIGDDDPFWLQPNTLELLLSTPSGNTLRWPNVGGRVPVDLHGQTFWVTFEAVVMGDALMAYGGVWSHEPPLSGGQGDVAWLGHAWFPTLWFLGGFEPMFAYAGGTVAPWDYWRADLQPCPAPPPWPYFAAAGAIVAAPGPAGSVRFRSRL